MEQISKRLMSWASILEDGTREQAIRTATLPFIFPHLALGAHLEYATINATPYQPEWIAAGVHADIHF